MRRSGLSLLLASVFLIAGCSRKQSESEEPPAPPPAQNPITPYHDWKLTEFGERSDVPDAKNGQVLTLLFDTAKNQVSGFAGCNQFSGGYTLDGKDGIKIGPLAVTKMACPQGMELETAYLGALDSAQRFKLIGAELQVLGANRANEMRFRPLDLKPPS
jgi:heat shock protein HslJ